MVVILPSTSMEMTPSPNVVEHDPKAVFPRFLGQGLDEPDLDQTGDLPEHLNGFHTVGSRSMRFDFEIDLRLAVGSLHFHGSDIESIAGEKAGNVRDDPHAVG